MVDLPKLVARAEAISTELSNGNSDLSLLAEAADIISVVAELRHSAPSQADVLEPARKRLADALASA